MPPKKAAPTPSKSSKTETSTENENQNIDDTFNDDESESETEQEENMSDSGGETTDSDAESEDDQDADVEAEAEVEDASDDEGKSKKKKKKADIVDVDDHDGGDDEDCYYDYEDPPEAEELNELADEKTDAIKPSSLRVPNDERVTRPVLTSYEFVRVLGTRAKQISLGAKPMIKSDKFKINQELSPVDIAKLEMYYNVCPLIIRRPIDADGRYEEWKLTELEKIDFEREVSHLLVN
jgi:DNA-directed RNA polymerase I, II, and III subunit RPABC2